VPVSPDHYFRVGSNTKTMTATVILQLVQERKLKLDDPVSKYCAGVPDGNTITIAQLLELRSGLCDYRDDPVFLQQPHKVWRPEELLALSFAKPDSFAPDAHFEYAKHQLHPARPHHREGHRAVGARGVRATYLRASRVGAHVAPRAR
jgi:D-alanyl-D-alanine carboxypeptidase